MKDHILPSIRLTLLFMLFFSGIYTVSILGIAQLSANKGNGNVIKYNGKVQYANIGQAFYSDKYFWSRPSAVNYNAASASGSNKGPTNPAYLKEVENRIDTFLMHNPGIKRTQVPSDIVTASGSGLDPHISIEAARVQVKRIAKIRGIEEKTIDQLIAINTEKPFLGIAGPGCINVLQLNIALDNLYTK